MKVKSDSRAGANSILRIVFVGVSVIIQAVWLVLVVLELNNYSTYISLASSVLAFLVVLKLYSKHTTSAMKMPWVMLILVFPVMGLTLYLLIVIMGDPGRTGKRLDAIRKRMEPHMVQDPETAARLAEENPALSGISGSLAQNGDPLYDQTDVVYYAEAAEAFEALKAELERAKKFIFMEYFIVEDGRAFHEIEEILARKAAQGVEVRLLYDDIGSIGYANFKFVRRLRSEGINCQVFNPALPVLNLFMNHRDHRKITVIDGRVGFTGGYNLAGEYFGYTQPYGKWKDTGLRLEGTAVRSLTATFLELWNVTTRRQEDDGAYLEVAHGISGAAGYVQPFGDNPLGRSRTAEDLYLNLIGQAAQRIWFITPYLIITDEMSRALGLAAKRGVDVRIITPGIPDKKTVYRTTRSYYAGLVQQGVRIFEYTPGFCHAKMSVFDKDTAIVGTTNLDYRSLYLHFENDVLLHRCGAVADIVADFEVMYPRCREVTEYYRTGRGALLLTWQCLLRLFAPLM
ncbi:MAG: cardiolipin synthase [Oscillospiraceae bacterium]|nr:cardiolipin synthase [Oscillospiraceae bacterium]